MDMEKLYVNSDWTDAWEAHKSMPDTFDREWLAHYAVAGVLARMRVSGQVVL